jgi:DNA-binding winged helix-turn-helix (wHTH) protein/tetratricopeptide (TPR) repeat protein
MLREMNNLQFGEFTLDRRARELKRGEAVLSISGKSFDLLAYMVENPGRPLSKSELLDAVWPETSVEESNLSQNVFLLRKVLGSDGPIKTLPGRGYQFTAPVTEIEARASSTSYTLPGPSSSMSLEATHTRVLVEDEVEEHLVAGWRPITLALFALLVLAGCGWLIYRHILRTPQLTEQPEIAANVPASQGRQVVAILGFRNFSNRTEDAWLSTALAEMLASEMSAGDKLRVIPNEATTRAESDLAMKDGVFDSEVKRASLRQATGADMLVQGSYVVVGQAAAPAIRLMVKVVDAHSGRQLASLSETGKLDSLFALLDQAGEELRKDLSEDGSRVEEEQALSGMSHSTEALRLYAEGLERERNFDSHSAQTFFERAIAADPNFAMAHLGLAEVWADLGFMERAAKESADAFKLSTSLPRAQRLAVEADYREFSKDYEHAISIYKSLSTFYPDDQTWGLKLAGLQRKHGRRKEAVETLERLRKLPLTPTELVELDGIEAVSYAHYEDPAANEKARSLLKDAIAIADRQGGLFIHGRAFRWECFALSHIGPVTAAQAACERSKTTFQAIGNLQGVEAATNNLGVIAQQEGNWKQAEADYEGARQLDHQLGNLEYEAMAVLNLAQLNLAQGDLAKTLKESDQLIHVKGTSDDYHMAFNGHFFAGWAMMQAGRLKEAKVEALEAERSADKEHPWDFKVDEQAHAREVLGSIALRAGDSAEARSFFREALTLNEPTHDDADKAVFIADEAAAALDQGDTGKPLLDGLRQAIEVLAKLQDHSDDAIEAALTLARLDMKTGATDEAVQAMAKARAIDSKGDSFAVHLNVLLGDAELKLFMSKASEARQVLQEEISLAKSKGYVYYDLAGEIALARLDARVTPSREATSRLRALGEKADRAGFKGLARQALTSVG